MTKAFLLALATLLFPAVLIGCQQPVGIVDKAYAATVELQTYRTFSSITSNIEGKTSEVTFETEFVAPDRYHAKTTTNGDWLEFIIIGDKQYVRDSDPSRKTSIAVSSSSILNKEDTLELLGSLTDLENLPDEKIEGIDCLHYRGRVDMERMIEEQKAGLDPTHLRYEEMLKGLEQLRDMKTEVELWIGKDDYLIRQVKQDMQVPLEGTSSAMVKYYDFNEPITIEPPETASGELLPGWRLVDGSPKELTFSRNVTFSIGGDDLAHQQISSRITITNIGAEVASNVRMTLSTMATNEEARSLRIEVEPSTPGPVYLEPGESETYHITWEYDASDTSKEELTRLVNLTTILAKHITPKGEEYLELLFPDAPYPSKTPPS